MRKSRKRVSRKRVSRKRVSRKRRVSKRGSRRRRSRNYRMRSRHPAPKCENLGRKACKKASHCKCGGKCERLSVTGPLAWTNLTRDFRNLPDDIRKYILEFIQKRKARFMDATPYLYGGHYGFALWHSPRPYDYDTTKIDGQHEMFLDIYNPFE